MPEFPTFDRALRHYRRFEQQRKKLRDNAKTEEDSLFATHVEHCAADQVRQAFMADVGAATDWDTVSFCSVDDLVTVVGLRRAKRKSRLS